MQCGREWGQLSPYRISFPVAGEEVEAGCSLCPTTFTKRQKDITHTEICSKATQHLAKSRPFSMLDLLPSHPILLSFPGRGDLCPRDLPMHPQDLLCVLKHSAVRFREQNPFCSRMAVLECWTCIGLNTVIFSFNAKNTMKSMYFAIFSWTPLFYNKGTEAQT